MEPLIVTSSMWGKNLMIPLYLFFGGLTAGLGIVAVVSDFLGDKNKSYVGLAKLSVFAAIPAWILGSVFVVFHLGKPMQGIFFPLYFSNYGSWMTYGGWAMGLGGPVLVVYAYLLHKNMAGGLRRLIGIINVPLMLWIALNTAMLLSDVRNVPLWDRAYLPALFINSGVLTGMAGAGLLFLAAQKWMPSMGVSGGSPHQVLLYGSGLMLVLEVIEAIILYALVSAVAAGTASAVSPEGSKAVYQHLVHGGLSVWFWFGVVVLGIIVPIALGVVELGLKKWEQTLAGLKFACILLGALALRFVIVWGGDFRPMPSVMPAVNVSQLLQDLTLLLFG